MKPGLLAAWISPEDFTHRFDDQGNALDLFTSEDDLTSSALINPRLIEAQEAPLQLPAICVVER